MSRKYQAVCTTWHVMHFWDLFNALKDDVHFSIIHNSWRDWKDSRFLSARGIPENASFVPYYEKGKYDFAILDVDQQVTNVDITGKRRAFIELNALIQDIPKVIINHGSPIYPEYYKREGMTDAEAMEQCKSDMRELVGNTPMVTNSHKAAEMWGWGTPIWHGMNPDDWMDLPKEPRPFTALSIGGFDAYYNRACMEDTNRILKEKFGYEIHWAKINVKTGQSPDAYKTYLGSSLLYLDTSIHTPMNRARTEAMLSGCCVVQVKGAHDIERFATEENMVLVPNKPKEIAEKVNWLIEDYQTALRIGAAGKETAKALFNYARYRKDWMTLIESLCA